MTQSTTELRQQSVSCNMGSRRIIQPDPAQATEPSQPALLATRDAMAGPSTPLQMSQPNSIPGVNTVDVLDSREEKPSTDQRAGAPPKLAKLASWNGGIMMVDGAQLHITEEMTEKFMHQDFRRNILPDQHGTLGWYQKTFGEQAHKELGHFLSAANARRECIGAQTVEGQEQPSASEDPTTILDSIIARDPERYLAWLSTMGYFHYATDVDNPCGFSWEDWCTWIAPRCFQTYCKQENAVMWPSSGLGAVNAAKYGQLGDKPTISLAQAKRGNGRALEFLDGDDGLEVSTKEKPQYYMIGGEATSREAAAHYHAIRGEDVWLFEPTNSFIEANDDFGRQREAEVEASFNCLGQGHAFGDPEGP